MITRVIEARPEELRVFLEEAAGVSKYRERRKETESRLADTRANLARVEDIRGELAKQLEKLEAQAEVATRYREHESSLKRAQHLLSFAKQQDAARQRERHAAEIANLTSGYEAIQAELRAAENRVETLRADQYRAGDELHEKQGAFYAANAEVTRLEQQLQFARESEGRLSQQAAQVAELLAGLKAQIEALTTQSREGEQELAAAVSRREQAAEQERSLQAALPQAEADLADAARGLAEIQQQIGELEQAIRVAETRRENADKTLGALAQRRERLDSETAALGAPLAAQIALVAEQLEQEAADLTSREAEFASLHGALQALQERQRTATDAWEQANRTLAEREARSEALAALQAKIGHSKDADDWLAARGLQHARRLWQRLDIENGWEDALEAVLRERLNALELGELDAALAWSEGDALPGRIAAYAVDASKSPGSGRDDLLLAKVKPAAPGLGRLLADWLSGVRCRASVAEALRDRGKLSPGEAFVTPQGHVINAQGISFFAPDSELHGVLARQRELSVLDGDTAVARRETAAAAGARDAVGAELNAQQDAYHAESLALSSQQRRCHELELELLQLKQESDTADKRRAAIAEELAALAADEATERDARAAIEAEVASHRRRLDEMTRSRDAAQNARDAAEAALEQARERVHGAERATQEAGFAERSCAERLAEFARNRAGLEAQIEQQQALIGQLTAERAQVDWSQVEASLQAQLAARGNAEQALAAARDRQEALATDLRAGEEERLSIEHKLEPARAKIEEMRLKQQAAVLAEQQFSEQLAEARADVAALPELLKAWGRASTLPGEIERLTQAIADLGAVNLAALDELEQAAERKKYLDAQAQDLTEAMATLEAAIRQIDRESRQLLQQTFDSVNANFGKLFPTLFGGGQARLVLTGEEILDAGVQVIAQPPGKRNTTIHLLSGGEKAMTAIALVFALFQLNPAPFCLLDEVDAPLDDPNTDRFCRMVQDMARDTQFLFISHNKITMEMANQLVGITMPEPGISRVVAVDIAEALELASTRAAA